MNENCIIFTPLSKLKPLPDVLTHSQRDLFLQMDVKIKPLKTYPTPHSLTLLWPDNHTQPLYYRGITCSLLIGMAITFYAPH